MRSILLLALILSVVAINPIVIKGKKFFDSVTKQQFYVKGVDYQPSGDPLADVAGLQRDIPLMQELGINTLRVYQTDYTYNHDAGMQLLANAGIYVIIDLSDPQHSINAWPPAWTTTLFDQFRKRADAFSGYVNTLGFLCGNEVILVPGSTEAAAIVKAAIRDLKKWLALQGKSKPVGYAAADVSDNDQMQAFLYCDSVADSADFYGINIYRWCGNTDVTKSGYAAIAAQWANYNIPYIFTEFGCNTVDPRPFTEIQAIYGPVMEDLMSGGLVYEWHQEANNYGLVTISGNTATKLPDFDILKNQLAAIKPNIANMDSYVPPQYGLQPCPAVTKSWASAAVPLPPTPNLNKCQCMYNSLTCRLTTEIYSPYLSQGQVDTLRDAQNIICNENPEWCWAVGAAPQYPSYGVWNDCNYYEKLSYLMTVRFAAHGNDAAFCSYSGLSTQVVTPTTNRDSCPSTANTLSFEGSYVSAGTTGAVFSTSTSGSSTTGSSNSGAVQPPAGGDAGCGAGLSACGGACYSPSSYCCQDNGLLPAGQCTAAPTGSANNGGQGTSGAATPSTVVSQTSGATQTSGASQTSGATQNNTSGSSTSGSTSGSSTTGAGSTTGSPATGSSTTGSTTGSSTGASGSTSSSGVATSQPSGSSGVQETPVATVVRQQNSSAAFSGVAWCLLALLLAML